MNQNFNAGPPEIRPDEVEVVKEIGKGSFGRVLQGVCRGQKVAVKVLHNQVIDERTLETFRKEVQIMSQLFHPNVVLFMGACTIPGELMIVCELLKGDLDHLLKEKKDSLSLCRRLQLAKDCVLGLNWLHGMTPPFIHRDVKPSNFLIDENLRVKICDFGLSIMKQPSARSRPGGGAGTPVYMAPEIYAGSQYTEKGDIYSFGVMLWQMATLQEPYADYEGSVETLLDQVVYEYQRPPMPTSGLDPNVVALIERCWHAKPTIRPTCDQILDELNNSIVNVSVIDKAGRTFWKKQFPGESSVTWKKFEKGLQALMNEEQFKDQDQIDLFEKCLFQLLAEKPTLGLTVSDQEYLVNIENFGKLLAWFGPLSPLSKFYNDIVTTIKESWFHGDISTGSAERLLKKTKKAGSFLVRFSNTNPGFFTISSLSPNGSIQHQRVIHRPGSNHFYLSEKRQYSSLVTLVQTEWDNLCLKEACAGSPFADIFDKTQVKASYFIALDDEDNINSAYI